MLIQSGLPIILERHHPVPVSGKSCFSDCMQKIVDLIVRLFSALFCCSSQSQPAAPLAERVVTIPHLPLETASKATSTSAAPVQQPVVYADKKAWLDFFDQATQLEENYSKFSAAFFGKYEPDRFGRLLMIAKTGFVHPFDNGANLIALERLFQEFGSLTIYLEGDKKAFYTKIRFIDPLHICLAEAFYRKENFAEAITAIDRVRYSSEYYNVKVSFLEKVADKCLTKRKWNEVYSAIDKIYDFIARDSYLVRMVEGYVEDSIQDSSLLNKAKTVAEKISAEQSENCCLVKIAEAYIQASIRDKNPDLLDQAVYIAGKLRREESKEYACYAKIVDAYITLSRSSGNNELLQFAEQVAGKLHGDDQKQNACYVKIIDAYIEWSKTCLLPHAELLAVKIYGNQPLQNNCYKKIAEGYIQRKHKSSAIGVIHHIYHDDWLKNWLLAAAKALPDS